VETAIRLEATEACVPSRMCEHNGQLSTRGLGEGHEWAWPAVPTDRLAVEGST